MRATQHIFRVRRQYNQWVGNQTLEDYALRFTATKARRWTIDQVAKTALGATAFLALEAIAAAITLQYGFINALWAMLTVGLAIFITGFPISYYAARYGLDIDLLTRSAGFGYLGSTLTSLIYASFTFIFFAIEAAILASALQALLGIPLAIGYILCAVAVIPIVTHGISAISKFQIGTQSFWLLLQISALACVAYFEFDRISDWTHYAPSDLPNATHFNLPLFGAAVSILFALIAQIGEQVDYLRFLPEKNQKNSKQWWFWLVLAGPGWIFIGLIKMLLGSFLAYLAITQGSSFERATDPTYMYQMAFGYIVHSPAFALILAGIMVLISQMKINVTNAYAGSIAWSNFFSRLTHNHPGRVVWLVFNVMIALILMELGIYRALEGILGIFSIIAISWLSSVSADLMINKPLGLSPRQIEFKRAHLYDINPVGVGSMLTASIVGIVCFLGYFGEAPKSLAHFISLGSCFVLVPMLAWLTKGRFYLARESSEIAADTLNTLHECCICENHFETADMSYCPAYQGSICSLCCSLDARCLDSCKPNGRISTQIKQFIDLFMPAKMAKAIDSRVGLFLNTFILINLLSAVLLGVIYYQMEPDDVAQELLLRNTLVTVFFILMIVFGVLSWFFLLARESREVAQEESNRQTRRLIDEIEAHQITDQSLQEAKELAERANHAKSRYLSGISHELRTPLQSILGYAQLLSNRTDTVPQQQKALQIIHRNSEYLNDLIEGLLDISKIEAGRLDIYRNKVKLQELLDQLVEMFSLQAVSKNIQLNYQPSQSVPPVVIADEKRLRQILINLLSNAIKYTQEGRVDFIVNYRNQVAEFTVKDTGIGIEENDLNRILDPFERVRNVDVPSVTGTGLGLTIVRLLTEVMGGELSVESEPGLGSTFKVSLMLSRVDSFSEPLLQPQPIKGYEGRHLNVMVVDDEAVHRGLVADLLSPIGFTVFEASDASNCLNMLHNCTPDLFLLDVSMPNMNGLELAEQLRNQGINAPIIMISADAQERHNTTTTSSAHDDYMVKPISTQTLLEKISRLLAITWIYEKHISQPSATASHKKIDPESFQIPDHELIRELAACADMGFYKGVNSTLAKIAKEKLVDDELLIYLQQLAEQFKYQQLCKILNRERSNDA